jgi:hypothetical protein
MKKFIIVIFALGSALFLSVAYAFNDGEYGYYFNTRLINNSNYMLTKINEHSYQMDRWDFPNSINSHKTENAIVVPANGMFQQREDDAGDVYYTADCGNQSIENIHIKVYFNHPSFFSTEVETVYLSAETYGAGHCVAVSPAHADIGWTRSPTVTFENSQ